MLWAFCARSVLREYGWRFLWRVAVRHPWRTARAVLAAGRMDCEREAVEVSGDGRFGGLEGEGGIVGVGFCLKPLEPACPLGRGNHDCMYLESMLGKGGKMPAACGECAIRELGEMALAAGTAFYVMTSAKDILMDVYVPALDERRFRTGVFTLCRYSLGRSRWGVSCWASKRGSSRSRKGTAATIGRGFLPTGG